MRANLIVVALSAGTLFAADRMNVSICNPGQLPDSVVARAKAEAESVFRSVEVRIEWKGCEDAPAESRSGERWYTLRLRNDKPLETSHASALDAMGRAFISDSHAGSMADAYFKAIEHLAAWQQADAGALLGYVIAHELGHLLLGPGHTADGVMRSGWNAHELKALRQHWLRFNQEECARIRQELRTPSK